MAGFMDQLTLRPDHWLGADAPQRPARTRHATQPIIRPTRLDLLNKVVESQVLPRLVLAHRAAQDHQPLPEPSALARETEELVQIVLRQDVAHAVRFVDALHADGTSAERLYLTLLSDAARRMGEMWCQDICDFTQVTVGVGRLQQVLRQLSGQFLAQGMGRARDTKVLLMPAPGEQHTFGLVVLSEFFRRAGWDVAGGPVSVGNDPAMIVRSGWFDVAGFSIGSVTHLESLAHCIRAARRVSHNRDLRILVGGPLYFLMPDLVARVGADAGAVDAPQAVRQAHAMLAIRDRAPAP